MKDIKFSEIVSIGGMPGLFRLLNQKADGIIVHSLDDDKAVFVSGRKHGFTALESIAMYLKNDDTTELQKVLLNVENQSAAFPAPDSNAPNDQLKSWFEKILPDYDQERVHISDIKKLIRWYGILKQKNLLPKPEETKAESAA